jgi:hypothetical protein
MEARRGLEENDQGERAFRVPVDSRLLDCFDNLWSSTKEVLSGMAMLWIQPIMDPKSLIDLSIGLLLMERVSANIQRYDPKMAMERANASPSSFGGFADGAPGTGTGMDSLFPGGILLGSPFIAVLGGVALALSCLSNAPYDTRIFASTWLRALLPRQNNLLDGGGASSAGLLYLLLLLFCFESMLMVSILMFGYHAITFPEWIEEDVKILTSLMGVWLSSLLMSSFVRYYFFYSIGD